jgi:putative two-component system response regulator
VNLNEMARSLRQSKIGRGLLRRRPSFSPQVILSAAVALEEKDDALARHSGRVGEISRQVAARMGLHPGRVSEVRLAGLLHDIGKIGLPDALLQLDTSIYSPDEAAALDIHTREGNRMLFGMEGAGLSAQVAGQHHERLDGSGHPVGLKAEDIVLEVRIVAVVEAAEEMCAPIPFGRGLGRISLKKELEEGRGTRYDARVVDAYLSLLAEGLEPGLLDGPLPKETLIGWWTGD